MLQTGAKDSMEDKQEGVLEVNKHSRESSVHYKWRSHNKSVMLPSWAKHASIRLYSRTTTSLCTATFRSSHSL